MPNPNSLAVYRYDGSFDGFLCCIFAIYEQKIEPKNILRPPYVQDDIFATTHTVATDSGKAARVWKGLARKLSAEAHHNIFQTFLSEKPEVEKLLFRYIKLVLGSEECMEQNYADASVLQVIQLGRKVWREKHRMEAFVRFREMADGTFLALISPDFNVLPLISRHFEERYADQKWVIYDQKRRYGLHYDLDQVEEVHLEEFSATKEQVNLNTLNTQAFAPNENQFQELWKCYFASVNIPERKNPKLHLRHVPRRYWKYLPEKQPLPLQKRLK